MSTQSLSYALCNHLPCELAQIIWQKYHSQYVLVEMLQVTKEKNQEYEDLHKDYQHSIDEMIDVVVRLSTSDSLVWEIIMTNTEENILLCEEVDEDMYKVFNMVKDFASNPSYLKIELSRIHIQTCDDLERMIHMCDTLQRMLNV